MYLVIWDFWLKPKFLEIDISVIKLEEVQDGSQVQPDTEEHGHDVYQKLILFFLFLKREIE